MSEETIRSLAQAETATIVSIAFLLFVGFVIWIGRAMVRQMKRTNDVMVYQSKILGAMYKHEMRQTDALDKTRKDVLTGLRSVYNEVRTLRQETALAAQREGANHENSQRIDKTLANIETLLRQSIDPTYRNVKPIQRIKTDTNP